MLPTGSRICDFRRVLGERYLPPSTKVFSEKGKVLGTLQDSDLVPEMVVVSEFKGTRNFYTHFTWRQTRKALLVLKWFFSKKEIRDRLQEMEASCSKSADSEARAFAFRVSLVEMLQNEVYPVIFSAIGLPEDTISQGLQIVMDSMRWHMDDINLTTLWFEVECLMGNMQNARQAYGRIEQLKSEMRQAAGATDEPPANRSCEEWFHFIRAHHIPT
eukprot:gnl/TRDRNA2_/TRDRNA2_173138_c2_seq1.p1 gnl/TRDRNA2_/TRDRNA2_173138_c2~~gnl/TRDRNA2_/TRDRNA2_173138_c2_seq1.p1  ORF type:complete len:249 (+),score=38.62 gnl/TRDRNA2_/TRDRNA2_173138_c2_seq1:101-748(+)